MSIFTCESEEHSKKQYLFLGHIYQWSVPDNNRIDYRFKGFNFGVYDQIWLGGDLCTRSNEKLETLLYLDSIFDLKAPTTHWALGNHDINHGPLAQIESVTKKPTFYSGYTDGMTLSVINTTAFYHPNGDPDSTICNYLKDQLVMLENISDTISESSHLVVLHHHNLITNQMMNDSLKLNEVVNLYIPFAKVGCDSVSTFEHRIFPILQKVQRKGIQVILVGGDIGQRTKSFEYREASGIWFLASGINNSVGEKLPPWVTSTAPDMLLVFERNIKEKSLQWRFEKLEDLLND